jgi:flagellin
MAAEIAEFTRNSIMVQSATAMLAQANATPRTVLTLIG